MRFIVVVLLGLMFADGLFAQCENGQCRPTPIRNSVATVVQAQPVRSAVQGVYQSVSAVRSKSSGSTGLVASYGSAGTSFRVGGRDKDGYFITSIGEPKAIVATPATAPVKPVPTPVESKPDNQVKSDSLFGLYEIEQESTNLPLFILGQIDPAKAGRDSFRSNLAKAVVAQRKAGKISIGDAAKLRVAMLSPAFLDRAHTLAVTQMAFSGEVDETNVPTNEEGVIQVDGINWEGLGKFLEVLVPLIISLLKAFGI